MTSLECIERFSRGVREHWGVENSLHWTLDVAFNEDKSTRKKGNSPANNAVLRHIILNLLKKEKTLKRSINTKRSHACLEKVVFG
ncbi:MAG: transposase [Bacteriovoracaceae bacterium]|nr:transposase [Bacteriovoracaceae bacterium]